MLLAYLYGQAIEPPSLLDQISQSQPNVSAPVVPEELPETPPAMDDVPVVPAE